MTPAEVIEARDVLAFAFEESAYGYSGSAKFAEVAPNANGFARELAEVVIREGWTPPQTGVKR